MRGITVTLYERTKTGVDSFHAAIYEETPAAIQNVLVAPVSDEERATILELTGRRAVYQMAIPKGDTHEWIAGTRVSFFGEFWRIIGEPTQGIDALIPLDWNKKVRVERCV